MKRTILFIALFYVVTNITIAQDQENSLSIESLEGLGAIDVVVEEINPEVRNYLINSDAIKNTVELQLRKAGIEIANTEEVNLEKGSPYLYVNVQIKPIEKTELLALSLEVELKQIVYLSRDRSKVNFAATWSRSALGDVGEDNLKDVKEVILTYVDEFANAYLSVN